MDQLSNNNAVMFNHYADKVTHPEYVKSASTSTSDVDSLPGTAFAYPSKRVLPINTAGNVWNSYLYFRSYPEQFSKVATYLEQSFNLAAASFGIEDDLKHIDTTILGIEKEASASDQPKFALTFEKEGTEHNYFPINDIFEIEESAREVINQSHKIPIEWQKSACEAIVEAAKEYEDVLLPDRVIRLGEKRLPDFEFAEKIASTRRWVIQDEEYLNIVKDIVKSASEDSEDNLDNYINLWLDVDRLNDVKYSHGVLSPYDAFYSGMTEDEFTKLANDNAVIHDVLVPMDNFRNLSKDKIARNFTNETADKIIGLTKESSASTVTEGLRSLSTSTQKEILKLLLDE